MLVAMDDVDLQKDRCSTIWNRCISGCKRGRKLECLCMCVIYICIYVFVCACVLEREREREREETERERESDKNPSLRKLPNQIASSLEFTVKNFVNANIHFRFS
jgi:hypothetical protein